MRCGGSRGDGGLEGVEGAGEVEGYRGWREAASWRSPGQMALPVTTRVNPAGLVRYIDRWPRAGVALRCQACPLTEDGGSAVPLLVIRRTNAAGSALVSSSEASRPSGVM